jgi:hypothetical protein
MSKKSDRPRLWGTLVRGQRQSAKSGWLKGVAEDYPHPETSTQERGSLDPGLRLILILGLAAAAWVAVGTAIVLFLRQAG